MMRTKIVATIGPSSASRMAIRQLIAAGMNLARLNFSHGTPDAFASWIKEIRSSARLEKRKVRILQDLQGPRIRVGEFPPEGRKLEEGEMVLFTTRRADRGPIFIDHDRLHLEIHRGDPLYLANGDMELIVERVRDSRIFARVLRGGTLHSRKSVNVPRTKLSSSGLTAKDIRDVKFGLAHGVDAVAISFVQAADDVKKLRRIVGGQAKIVAKIETSLALEHIDGIIRESDAIMIARGDLGIEIPIETVPSVQKNLIRHAQWYGKGTITATQMLISMVDHVRPTRAEVSDVANAVWDGTDAVMLSDETASGKYPVESLRMMVRIVREAESLSLSRPNPLDF
jgi:pyruvate kinase